MPEVATGTYTGNAGTLDVNLTFNPAWVCIFRHGQLCWQHMKTMTAGHAINAGGSERLTSGGITLGTGKFTLGSNAGLNASGQVHHYLAIAEELTYAKMGTFTGNGNPSQSIVGVGFQPDLIIVIVSAAVDTGYLWSAIPGGDATFRFHYGFAPNAGYITGVHSDGFNIGGPGAILNGLGNVCYYVALRVKPLNVFLGTYTGNGVFSGRAVAMGDPFLPKVVLVHPTTTGVTIIRPNSLAGDHSFHYANGINDIGYAVQTLTATGFTVGYECNTDLLPFFYFAFQANSEIFDNAIGYSARESVQLDALLASVACKQIIRDEVLADQAFPPDFLMWEFEMGETIRKQVSFDSLIATAIKDRNLYPQFDYVLGAMAREQVNLDTILADFASRLDAWAKETFSDDTWAKESPVADDWVKESPPADSWSKE